MNCLRWVTVRHRQSGETFPYPSYTASLEESLALARLTFAAAAYEVTADPQDWPPNTANTASQQLDLNL